MSWQNIIQLAALVVLLALTVPPLGRYIAAVFGARDDGSAPSGGVCTGSSASTRTVSSGGTCTPPR